MRRIPVAILAVLLLPRVAAAATCTWTGGSATTSNWSDPLNWDVCGGAHPLPIDGDTLVFPGAAARLANSNDISGLDLVQLQFTGPDYSIGGFPITLTSGITASGSGGTDGGSIVFEITLMAAQTFQNTGAHSFSFSLTHLNGFKLTIDATSDMFASGNIDGAGGLTKNGTGQLTLQGTGNTYTGVTTINAGIVNCLQPGALGDETPGNGTIVNSGATLILQGVDMVEELTLNGTGVGGQGALEGNNPPLGGLLSSITLGSATTINVPNSTLRIFGPISGAFPLTKIGGGTLTLEGGDDTYTNTTITGGILRLNKTAGFTGIPSGVLTIGDGLGTDSVVLDAADQIADTTTIVFLTGGTLNVSTFHERVASISGPGAIAVDTGGQLIVGGNNGSTTYSGPASGAGVITKEGTGALTLTGANTIAFSAQNGQLIVDGTQPNATVNSTTSQATILGTGSAGTVNIAAGTLAPGHTPGLLTTGPLTFSSGSTFAVEINGATPGTQYDRVNVVGTVNLGSATLAASIGFVPVGGTQFVIISNDGVDPVVGTFAGLSNGTGVVFGGQPFTILYTGGDGNDVVLMSASAVPLLPGIYRMVLLLAFVLVAALALRRRVHA